MRTLTEVSHFVVMPAQLISHNHTDTISRVAVPVAFVANADGCGNQGWAAYIGQFVEFPAVVTYIFFDDNLDARSQPLQLYYPATQYLGGETPNRCITALTKKKDPNARCWYGSVLVLKRIHKDILDFVDVQQRDKKDIQGYFARLR